MSLNTNLIQHHQPDMFTHRVLLLHDQRSKDTRFNRNVGGDTQQTFEYSSLENIYAVLRRLRKQIPDEPGVIVSNNELELALLCVYDVEQTTIQIVHDEYNLRLAIKYASVVDVFVAHSNLYYEKLRSVLPNRLDTIYYLPYGIPLAPSVRRAQYGPLRLVFLGRMHEAKGIFDLPVIDKILVEAGVEVQWTLIGDGPERKALQEQWGSPAHVCFCSPATNAEVLRICAKNDVFVLPTRFEGFPVSLLETMSAGLVPIISNLPSGIPEVVSHDTGYRPAIGDCTGFANAILELDRERNRLETMSQACRRTVEERFDIHKRVVDYQSLFARYKELRQTRHRGVVPPLTQNRLDKPWLPNWLVRTARQGIRRFTSM